MLDHRIYFGVSFSDYRVILLPLEAPFILLLAPFGSWSDSTKFSTSKEVSSHYVVRYGPDYQKQRAFMTPLQSQWKASPLFLSVNWYWILWHGLQ